MRENQPQPVLPYERIDVSRDLSRQEIIKAGRNLRITEKLGSRPVPREIDLAKDAKGFIRLAEKYLEQEIRELGIDAAVAFNHKRVHVADFKNSDFPCRGLHSAHTKGSYVNRRAIARGEKTGEEAQFELFWTILHELTHSIQFRNMVLSSSRNKDVPYYRSQLDWSQVGRHGFKGELLSDNKRIGYHSWYNRFQVFNEAVTERIGVDILRKHWDELRFRFDFFPNELPPQPEVDKPLEVMDLIAKRLSSKSGSSEKEVWRKWLRGQFTGEMMHLRELEKYFGPGTLEILANWENWRKYNNKKGLMRSKQNPKLFMEYFMTDSQARRDSIAKQILPESHWRRYERMGGLNKS